jgi:hypothetical protein
MTTQPYIGLKLRIIELLGGKKLLIGRNIYRGSMEMMVQR